MLPHLDSNTPSHTPATLCRTALAELDDSLNVSSELEISAMESDPENDDAAGQVFL